MQMMRFEMTHLNKNMKQCEIGAIKVLAFKMNIPLIAYASPTYPKVSGYVQHHLWSVMRGFKRLMRDAYLTNVIVGAQLPTPSI